MNPKFDSNKTVIILHCVYIFQAWEEILRFCLRFRHILSASMIWQIKAIQADL